MRRLFPILVVLSLSSSGCAYKVGSGVVSATGDALDGPERDVKLTVKVKKFSGGTKTYTRTVESDDIEKTLEKLGKKGTIIDVRVDEVD